MMNTSANKIDHAQRHPMERLRQTGRTTRMITEAKRLAGEGRAVYILAAGPPQKNFICDMIGPDGGESLGIKVETLSSLGGGDRFDWCRMKMTGSHPNCVWLVDHFTIEQEFAPILKMLHRFDE